MTERIYAETNSGKIIPKGELIRCKDCKYYPNGDGSTKWLPCMEIITQPGWFCADGERKDNDNG